MSYVISWKSSAADTSAEAHMVVFGHLGYQGSPSDLQAGGDEEMPDPVTEAPQPPAVDGVPRPDDGPPSPRTKNLSAPPFAILGASLGAAILLILAMVETLSPSVNLGDLWSLPYIVGAAVVGCVVVGLLFTDSGRTPQRRHLRSALVISLSALLLLAFMVGGFVIYFGEGYCNGSVDIVDNECSPCCGTPLGAAFVLYNAQVSSSPGNLTWIEEMDVGSAATTLTLNNLGGFIIGVWGPGSSTWTPVTPPPGSEVVLEDGNGTVVGVYSFPTAQWTEGSASAHVTSEQTLVLLWTRGSATDPLRGDSLLVQGENGFGGDIAVTLA